MTRRLDVIQKHLAATFCCGIAAGTINIGSDGRLADYPYAPEGFKKWRREDKTLCRRVSGDVRQRLWESGGR